MSLQEVFGGLSVVTGILSSAIYLAQIYRHKVKPHMFSWFIWSLLASIAAAAQYAEKGGAGVWSLGACAVLSLIVAAASYFYGEKHITRSDWAAFLTALLAIPLWLATANPLWAVVIVVFIDAAAFYPTVRKAWLKPLEESLSAFFLGGVQFLLAALAIENITLTTALYPAAITVMNMGLVGMLVIRRKAAT